MKFLIFTFTLLFVISCTTDGENFDDSGTLSGSYASMLVIDNFLYAVSESDLTTFDITDTKDPKEVDKQNVGFDIENIYHNAGVLFIGSETALHIFEIQTSGIPLRKSETQYFFDEGVTSCDPVIANEDYAYVTLSSDQLSEGPCPRFIQINELRIYDVENIEQPALLEIYPLDNPKGLTLVGDYLFVCLANTGFEVLDVSNPLDIIFIDRIVGFKSYDVIAKDGLLMVVGPTEIRQYDINDINNIEYLSSIDL